MYHVHFFFDYLAIYVLCETARAIGQLVSTRPGHDEQEHFHRKRLIIIHYLSHEEDVVTMKCAEAPIVCSIQKPTNRAERSAHSRQEYTH